MSDTQAIHAQVRQYIFENFLYMRPEVRFADDDPLLGRGIVDSLGVMELLEFVAAAFGVDVADEDLTEANFGSVGAIARYVARREARPSPRAA
jgi:acyl carrier protein